MSAARQQKINSFIQEKGEVKLGELSRVFTDISRMTLRRDLLVLEQEGKIVMTRGGAKSMDLISMLKEAAYLQRVNRNIGGKQAIAEKAIAYISPGRSIYIDAGTTCMCLAQKIPDESLIVITSAPNIALELMRNQNVRISLTGGLLNRDTLSMTDTHAIEYVKSINIDIAFIAASAFTLKSGFTCGDYSEMELKRLIIGKADQVIILMDKSKLDISLPYTFARQDDIDVLITDGPLPEAYAADIQGAGVALI